MGEFWLLMFAIGLVLYVVAKAIARRFFQPKTAIIVAMLLCACFLLMSGDVQVGVGIALACGVVDLLRTSKPV